MKILRVINNNYKHNNQIKFKSVHVLPIPEEYSNLTQPQIWDIIEVDKQKREMPQYKPLVAMKNKFVKFVSKNYPGNWNVLNLATLRDGKLAFLRITDVDEVENIAFSTKKSTLWDMIEDSNSFHYKVANNAVRQIKRA